MSWASAWLDRESLRMRRHPCGSASERWEASLWLWALLPLGI